MKAIELRIFDQVKEDGSKTIFKDYKEILIIAVRAVNPQNPPNLEQMAEKIGIINKIKSLPAGAILELDNSEFRTLASACAEPIWTIIDEDLYNCLAEVKKINEGQDMKKK